MNSCPQTAEHTHKLDLGKAGAVVVSLKYQPDAITAAVDAPGRLDRRERRLAQRWLNQLFRRLDPDARGLRLIVTSKGRLVSVGTEYKGVCAIVYA